MQKTYPAHLEGVDLCPDQQVKDRLDRERDEILLGNQNSFHSLDTEEVGEKFSLSLSSLKKIIFQLPQVQNSTN